MQALRVNVELSPDLTEKVRAWLRRRDELRAVGEQRELSPLEAQEYILIDSRLAAFASSVIHISDPQPRTLH